MILNDSTSPEPRTAAAYRCSRPGRWLIRAGLMTGLLLTLAAPAGALEFECNRANDQRFIHVDMPGKEHLCDVSVDYPDGRSRVLWYADHDTLFCSAKAYELRDKYRDVWNFECRTWPDRDGIDQLSARNRYILDQQLKDQIERLGRTDSGAADARDQAPGERVVAIKTAVSQSVDEQPGTLAVQYFIGPDDQSGDISRDFTQVIVDQGESWRVIARINGLAGRIETADGSAVDSAIISGVTEDGLLKVETAAGAPDDAAAGPPTCLGQQYFQVSSGRPVPQGPHRMVCGNEASSSG